MNLVKNYSINTSSQMDPIEIENERLLPVAMFEMSRRINLYASIVIVFTGLIGNSLTAMVFSQKRFRTNSSNCFLLFLSILDSFYLILHLFEDTVRSYNEIYLTRDLSSGKPIDLIDYLMMQLNITSLNELACIGVNYLRYSIRASSAYIG